jgi:hypothetical protein
VGDDGFAPTHEVPAGGLPTWAQPDPTRPADHRVDGGIPVQVLEENLGWAHIRCSNTWEAWVDGRLLVPLATAGFVPTHRVPATGLDARPRPDVNLAPTARLDAGIPVAVEDSWGEWVKVRCSNGWTAWVDGRNLPTATAADAVAPGAVAPATAAASAGAPSATSSPLALWLPIAGAALAILGGVLPWYSVGGESISAWDIPVDTLVTHDASDFFLDTGPVLLVLALAALPLLTRRLLPPWAYLALAAVAIVLAVLGFVLYLDFDEPRPDLGIGLILTMIGGLVIGGGALAGPGGPLARR